MKTFLVSLMSAATLLVPTQVLAEDWVQVSEREIVDADSIAVSKYDSNIRIYWTRFQWNRPGFVMTHRLSNCATGYNKTLEVVVYNNAGRVIDQKSFEDEESYIVPGTNGSSTLNFVCQ